MKTKKKPNQKVKDKKNETKKKKKKNLPSLFPQITAIYANQLDGHTNSNEYANSSIGKRENEKKNRITESHTQTHLTCSFVHCCDNDRMERIKRDYL